MTTAMPAADCKLDVPHRTLMGPGPSDVPDRVLAAMSRPTIGHLDPAFLRLMDEIRQMLKVVFGTANEMTLAVSGTGSAGAECLMDNLVEPGDVAVIGIAGVFGGRLKDKAERAGATVHTVEAPWGEPIDQDAFIAKVEETKPAVAAIVHAETSTGLHQPVDRIGAAVHKHGGLFVLDCVTSLAGLPVTLDAWEVDAAYSGTQKCLSCPPGLAPVTFSERAMKKVTGRKTKVNSWYLDVTFLQNYWSGSRAYHHTAPINMNYALHEALTLVMEEGLDARYARHRRVHEQLAAGLAELGVTYRTKAGYRLPMLNLVNVPAGVDEAAARKRMLNELDLELGGGLGAFAGKCWRIGLMGASATDAHVERALGAIRHVM